MPFQSGSFESVVVSLEDGAVFVVRPVTPDDKPLLLSGFERMSPRSRYQRFFTPATDLSARQLAYLCELDHRDHVALGVLDHGTPVAVGRFVRFDDDPWSADTAMTVVDDYQGRGVARMLLKILALAARHRDVRWLHFDVLADNRAMLAVLDRFDAVRTETGPIVHAVLDAEDVAEPAGMSGDLLGLIDRAAG